MQGCLDELLALLDVINLDEGHDKLWFTGDLVNRGPQSLEVLRFVKNLGDRAISVLGNHDLHLIALAYGTNKQKKKDTIGDVLAASDRDELTDWLRRRPLIHHDSLYGFTLVHAGVPPQWDLEEVLVRAREVEEMLRSEKVGTFFSHMYGDRPFRWDEGLKGWERLRFIINCFTRLRFCDQEGNLLMEFTGPPGQQSPPFLPWFEVPWRKSAGNPIVFGHWASLGFYRTDDIFALDSGCVWGGSLSALRLDDGKHFSIPCKDRF